MWAEIPIFLSFLILSASDVEVAKKRLPGRKFRQLLRMEEVRLEGTEDGDSLEEEIEDEGVPSVNPEEEEAGLHW